MSRSDQNRVRNKMVSFRLSPEEQLKLEARIKVSGMRKGQYIIKSLLNQELTISVGKYQSDRLSLELKRLREKLLTLNSEETALAECKSLLEQLAEITLKERSK